MNEREREPGRHLDKNTERRKYKTEKEKLKTKTVDILRVKGVGTGEDVKRQHIEGGNEQTRRRKNYE